MSAGITINQAATDDEILAFKSSDISHAYSVRAEVDTYGTFMKIVGSTGGMLLTGYATTSYSLWLRGVGGTPDTTKATNSFAAVVIDGGIASAGDYAAMSADGNILAIRNLATTCWICDEDGDTWQTGGVTAGNQCDFSSGGTNVVLYLRSTDQYAAVGFVDNATTADGYNYIGCDGDNITIKAANIANIVYITGTTLFLADTANANMTRGITINQAGADDEILAFKSSDVDHDMTDFTETDTYGTFRKVTAADGGIEIRGYSDAHRAVYIYGGAMTENTTKSTAGEANINLDARLTDGIGGWGNHGANANIVCMKMNDSTRWILDEDGDTWQSGVVSGLGARFSGWSFPSAGAAVEIGVSGGVGYVQAYNRSGATYDTALAFKSGSLNTQIYLPANLDFVCIGDTSNANMTIGLTLNQGANDDEILAFKSTDIAHGNTTEAETDTYAYFKKLNAAQGGLWIGAVAEDANVTVLQLRAVGGQADTTKTSGGTALSMFYASEISGGAYADVTANGNVFGVRARVSSAWTTVYLLDEDGDTWQSGYATLTGIIAGSSATTYAYFPGANRFDIVTNAGSMTASFLSGIFYINDTANANMTQGITINQGANDDELLAFKSSDVAHGATHYADTATFGYQEKSWNAYGGLRIVGIAEDHASATSQVLALQAIGGTAQTTKSTSGIGLIDLYVSEHDGAGASSNITADGNILSVRCRVGGATVTRWILDEDGDTWQNGNATIENQKSFKFGDGGELIYGDNTGTMLFYISGSARHRMSGAADNEILALKSSDVAHGVTDYTETDTYGSIVKYYGDNGGLWIRGFNDTSNIATVIMGVCVTDDGTKSAAGTAPVVLNAAKKSGTGVGACGDSANILVVQENGSTRFLIDEDGDFHYDGADQGAYDEYDDALICRDLNMTLSSRGEHFLRYNKEALVALGVVSPALFVSGKRMNMLQIGAISQLYDRINILEEELKQLREEKING
jgi:glycerol kinase